MIKTIRDSITGIFGVLIAPNLPRTSIIVALVIGTLVGLFWGYNINSTVYYDADPSALQQTWQNEWVKLLADRYAAPTNVDISANIVDLLTRVDNPLGILDALIVNPAEVNNVGKLQAIRPFAEQAQSSAAAAPNPNDLWTNLRPWLLAPLALAIAAVIFIVVYNLLIAPAVIDPLIRRLRGEKVSKEVVEQRIARQQETRQLETQKTNFVTTADYGLPLLQRMTTYPSIGGTEFDESYEIEENDMFLGQCGAVYSDALDTPGMQLMAIEVWLFDKDDFVRTLTKVFVSESVFNNPTQRAQIITKGEPTLAEPGAIVILETNSLRLQARIVEMQYAPGATPNSVFQRVVIELAAWHKTTGVGTAQQVVVGQPVIPMMAA
ncbi:MAG: hypothetical protein SGJ24_13535, partial [Chloroflexota bacterium]|nr:hypothetical protein [Chloroflexota bacterium]